MSLLHTTFGLGQFLHFRSWPRPDANTRLTQAGSKFEMRFWRQDEATLHFRIFPTTDERNRFISTARIPERKLKACSKIKGSHLCCRKHEDMSVQMFDAIVEEKQLFESGDLTREQAERVKAMILAGSEGTPSPAYDLFS